MKKSTRIFLWAIAFRLAYYVLSVCIIVLFGDFQESFCFSDFLDAWARWDSAHYLNIAENGYMGAVENGEHIFLVFYPLYPWMIRSLHVLGIDYRLGGMLVSTVCFGIGCVYFEKLTSLEFGGETAKTSVLLLSVFPFAFFFGGILTESLFFALSAMFLYFLRCHRWDILWIIGLLACMTKVQGCLLAFAVVAELFYSEHALTLLRTKRWKALMQEVILPGLETAFMFLGLGVYLLINFMVEGDAFRFLYYQKNHWNNELGPIWNTLGYLWRYVAGEWHTPTGMALWVPELVLSFLYIGLIIYGCKRRLRPMYQVYLISFFVLTYSSTWLISGARYTVNALPLFMLGGEILENHRKVKQAVLAVSFALMIIYLIGWYEWKQIM